MKIAQFHYLYLSLISLIFLSGCNKDVKETFQERDFISLVGIWKSDLGDIHLPGTVDESKLAPLTQDTINTTQLTRLRPYEGKMKYSKEITITPEQADREWRLVMERTKPSVLYIDGDSIGSSSLLLSPQIYDIGKLSVGNHIIAIEIDNGTNSVPNGIKGSHAWTNSTQTNWNGIIGKFGLEAYNNVLIESIHVYPSPTSNTIPVIAKIKSSINGKAQIVVKGYTWNTEENITIPTQEKELNLNAGENIYRFEIEIGDKKVLWSEFDPALYKVNFELNYNHLKDYLTIDFGIRDFSTEGTQFTINSLRTFLRGKHDACIFPLTGYPPMEKEEWIRQMKISKEYGFNHYRFHSWTPPQAAFDAANELGIYMQPELPYWGEMKSENADLNDFLIREGKHILDSYGNNPSFVMMALGNELGGDFTLMRDIVHKLRAQDSLKLYAFGSNNALGTAGPQRGEDFFVTCRVGGQVGSDDYSQHTRTTFSFADAKYGGYMNGLYPSTDRTFSTPVSDCKVPIISHENGQFQMYPDYDEIKKYTGILYPYNLEIFRQRLIDNGMIDQAKDFHKATVQFAALCYKADIETCLRTAGFGGFQLLDLQDYPGQGSAYVGLLDVFMDSKEGVTSQTFTQSCSDIVLLASMSKYCWNNSEHFKAQLEVFNYSSQAIKNKQLEWSLSNPKDNTIVGKGNIKVNVAQGQLSNIFSLDISLNTIKEATKLNLNLTMGDRVNQYDVWVYPEQYNGKQNNTFEQTSSLNNAISMLDKGKNVLYVPNHREIEDLSVGGMFTPDYWNYAMFKNISEWLKRDVSPGTLSILTNPNHPLFNDFPTESYSNWQWWVIMKNSRPFILDKSSSSYRPLVQVIDNIERNHRLGLVFEMNVAKGKLLVCMVDLEKVKNKPEGEQFYRTICNYMNSNSFSPAITFSKNELKELFTSPTTQRNIKGVKNITSYK